MKAFRKADEAEILAWARKPAELARYLVSGSVHGKPGLPLAELSRIEKILKRGLAVGEQFALGCALIERPEYSARCLALPFIEAGWPGQKRVEKLIQKAAEDEDWIVREAAAGSLARLLESDFRHFAKLCKSWVQTGSVNQKRAVALAVKYDAKSEDSAKWKTYIDLIEPLMSEEAEYIRKNLGQFAIGDGLLSRFPERVLHCCQRWSRSKDSWTRWNLAMIFTAAAARKYAKQGKPLLIPLIDDPDPAVARAAKKALRSLSA